MKKLSLSIALLLILLSFAGCGIIGGDIHNITDVDNMTDDSTSVEETDKQTVPNQGHADFILEKGLDSYNDCLEKYAPPSDFVSYDDVSVLGDFSSWKCTGVEGARPEYDDEYEYLFVSRKNETNTDEYFVVLRIYHGFLYELEGVEFTQVDTHSEGDMTNIVIDPNEYDSNNLRIKSVVKGTYCDIVYYYYPTDLTDNENGLYELYCIWWEYDGNKYCLTPQSGYFDQDYCEANDAWKALLQKSTADEIVSQIIENVKE